MIVGAGGYARIVGPDGIVEMDTITCNHCGRVVHETAEQRIEEKTSKCAGCMKRICRRCTALQRCIPLEKTLEDMERKFEADRRSDALFRMATSG